MAALFISYGVIAILMVLLWGWQCRTGKGSVVDVAWTTGVAVMGIWQLLVAAETVGPRQQVVACCLGAWGLRLAIALAWRIARLPEDGRYLAMNRSWGDRRAFRMFLFYQFQAIGCLLFAWPFYIVASHDGPWSLLDYGGLICCSVGILGVTVSDVQLTRFRLQGPSGRVCQEGLWRYSRHPNYFFEFVHWCSYVFFGWSAVHGPWLLLLPAMLLVFIFFVTGIPPTERQALATRGEAYREYQRTTSVFVPWPVKRDAPESAGN